MLQLRFSPGLALTDFWTTQPWRLTPFRLVTTSFVLNMAVFSVTVSNYSIAANYDNKQRKKIQNTLVNICFYFV